MAGIRDRLAQGLGALGACASGAPAWAASQLDALSPLVTPLLTSPLVGEGAAFACTCQLAACLRGGVGWHAADVASALRTTRMTEEVSHLMLCPRGAPCLMPWPGATAVHVPQAAGTAGGGLQGDAWEGMCFWRS